MLEEAIRNYEKVHPAEIALAMLSFIQSELPAGGTAAESRFLNLFLPLCDCIFGPILLDLPDKSYRHKDSGWMSVQKQWPRATPSLGTPSMIASPTGTTHLSSRVHLPSQSSTTFSNSLDSDPVVKLLGTAGKPQTGSDPLPLTFIEAISKESEHRPSVTFPLKFHALPLPLQESWLVLIKQVSPILSGSRIVTSCATSKLSIPTDNDLRLLGHLLRKGLNEQSQLHLFSQRSTQLTNVTQPDFLRQQQYLDLNSSVNSKSSTPSGATPSTQNPSLGLLSSPSRPGKESPSEIQNESPDVMLSMLEYYLFIFLRFPLASPERGRAGSSSTPSSSSIPGVHVHRIATVPSSVGENGRSHNTVRIAREAFGDTLYYHIVRRYMRHFLPYQVDDSRSIAFGDEKQFPESELFLRICIAMWLESRSRLTPTEAAVQLILERRRRRTGILNENLAPAAPPVLDLNTSYDLTHTFVKYDPLPAQIHKYLRTLIIHAILDPSLIQSFLDRQRSTSNSASQKWCLSQCLTVLQQPIYNYLRTTFRFAPIHSTSESSFFGALNIWLIWLEPWNTSQSRHIGFSTNQATQRIMGSVGGNTPGKPAIPTQRTLNIPRHNQASKYDAVLWEPYVAANVYMYAVPLAIFLVRARELDFSKNNFDRSMEIVHRVFRVFTPALVDAVSRHLDASSNSTGGSFQVEYHRRNLGQFAPPQSLLSLSSLKADMQSLLEEINMQHMKKVRELDTFDWLIGKVEGLFGAGVVSGEEKTLISLVERAKMIVRLPVDFDLLPLKGYSVPKLRSEQTPLDKSIPLTRTKDGELTDFGREQLVLGAIRFRPDEVVLGGDNMRAKVGSHEISILVDAMIWASDVLNESVGLSPHGKIRINLRFFADYRNLGFVIIVLYLLIKLT